MRTYVAPEANKYAAASLALLVHGGFFTLLYFGFSWQTQVPTGMVVEIWQSLPDTPVAEAPARVEPPAPVEVAPKIEPPVAPPKADIALPEKKIPLPALVKPAKPEPVKPIPVEQTVIDAQAIQRAEAQLQAAATARLVDEYVVKIRAKIKRNIVRPPDLTSEVQAEFDVTVMPGGAVLNTRLKKSSGNAAYDSAVERAITKAQPLPVPIEAAMFNRFRELNLKFSSAE